MIRAVWNDVVVAESDATVMVEGNHYFPPDAVNWEFLRSSESHSVCPWKGTASYFNLDVHGATNPDAAWTYPQPHAAAAHIKGYVAFWRGVQVR